MLEVPQDHSLILRIFFVENRHRECHGNRKWHLLRYTYLGGPFQYPTYTSKNSGTLWNKGYRERILSASNWNSVTHLLDMATPLSRNLPWMFSEKAVLDKPLIPCFIEASFSSKYWSQIKFFSGTSIHWDLFPRTSLWSVSLGVQKEKYKSPPKSFEQFVTWPTILVPTVQKL